MALTYILYVSYTDLSKWTIRAYTTTDDNGLLGFRVGGEITGKDLYKRRRFPGLFHDLRRNH